jgi:outer membrane autotransporter protein
VTPFVAVEPAALWQQAYTESATTAGGGAGTLGLSYAARETTSLPTFVGAQLDTQYFVGEQTVRPFLRAAWVHEFMRERQIEASFVSIPAASFTVDGTRPAGDAARISGGLTWTIDASKAVFARVDSEFSGSGTMVAGTAGARIIW